MLSDMSPYVHLQSMGQTFKTHEDSGGKTAPEWETAEVKSVFTFTLGDMDDDLLRDTKMFVTIKNGSTTVADAELALADLTRGGGSDRKWYTVRTDGEPKGNIMLSTKYRDPVAERAAAEARAKAEAEAKALAEQLEQAKRDREAAEQAATKAAADREAAAADRAAAEAALARLEAAQKAAEEAKAKEAEAQVSYDAKVEENEKAGYQFGDCALCSCTLCVWFRLWGGL